MHNLANYVKQGLTLAHGSSLKTPDDTYLFLIDLTSSIALILFFTVITMSSSYTVFNGISSNIEQVPSVHTYRSLFVFGSLKIHVKD